MTKIITSLFDHSAAPGKPMLHWELEGVMIVMLVLLGLVHWFMPASPRRNKIVLWTILLYYIYLAVLLAVLATLAIRESYATS